nr:30S ribosomal protein S4 [Candidatus Sigynarchaeota archaeon]
MGDPRKPKKKYKTPNKLWDKPRLEEELRLIGEYGLRNKREIWRHKTFLSGIRRQGREIQAAPTELQKDAREKLVARAHRLGILDPVKNSIDDVLNLNLRDICNRRLQTFVYKKGLAATVQQARQLIVHRHIAIDGQIVNSPGHLVLQKEEDAITYTSYSSLNDPNHPLRQQIEAGSNKAVVARADDDLEEIRDE